MRIGTNISRVLIALAPLALFLTWSWAAQAGVQADKPVPVRASPVSTAAPERTAFMNWAKASLSPLSTVMPGHNWGDLQPLGRMIGNATLVSLSEGVHAAKEPLEFRNRVLQYLIEEKGFTAIAIESGIVEGRTVHDYVLGGSGDLAAAVAQGITWTFDRLPQNQALVRWLRDYNADPRHARKVNFYGFDIPGSLNTPVSLRAGDTALTAALSYLASVDHTAAAAFRTRLAPLLPNIRFYLRNPADGPGENPAADGGSYDRLTQAERDALSSTIADLITLLERQEARYTAASSPQEYAWGYRAAIGARQSDDWLRQIPLGWAQSSGAPRAPAFLSAAADVRDRAQADNLEWVVGQEGTRGKVLIFAHLYHLSTAPVKTEWYLPIGVAGGSYQQVAGTYLKRRFADHLLTVGNLVGHGETGCGDFHQKLAQAPPYPLETDLTELGAPLFLLDMRAAPAGVTHWLDEEQALGQKNGAFTVSVAHAFDILFYIDTVSPACSR